jgi:hypothetical protein
VVLVSQRGVKSLIVSSSINGGEEVVLEGVGATGEGMRCGDEDGGGDGDSLTERRRSGMVVGWLLPCCLQ